VGGVAHSSYGRSHAFRTWLEKRGRPYAVTVPKTNAAVRCQGRRKKIGRPAKLLPEEARATIPAREEEDSGERRAWGWARLELSADPAKGMRRWLLIRRGSEDPEDLAF
jgi:hypothetical protein